jgi:hypothetical protein
MTEKEVLNHLRFLYKTQIKAFDLKNQDMVKFIERQIIKYSEKLDELDRCANAATNRWF